MNRSNATKSAKCSPSARPQWMASCCSIHSRIYSPPLRPHALWFVQVLIDFY